jgi:hypothetical protein
MNDSDITDVIAKYINKNLQTGDNYDEARHHAINIMKAMKDKRITCGFCESPCGNDHCPVTNENKKDN